MTVDIRAGRDSSDEYERSLGLGRILQTAFLVTVILSLSSLLGFVRDLLIARYFGASGGTDAFLIAWTVPETATPLLMEGAVAYLLVPAFTRAIEREGSVQNLVNRTLVPVLLALATLSAVVALLAPLIVDVLAPGLADPHLAVRCLRVASLTILFLGTAGYLMAVLRCLGYFLVTAWAYVTYNIGILSLILLFHNSVGVYIAAVGLALGGACMVCVQAVPFLRRVQLNALSFRLGQKPLVAAVAFLPLATFTLGRQAQVYVERFLGSGLESGTISQLNYASKIAQIPMQLSLAVVVVSFPALARSAAAGRLAELRTGVNRNLRIGAFLILPAIVFLVVFSRQVIEVLLQRGAFSVDDTAATAEIMRIYSFGLLGQTVVGVCTVCYFALASTSWYPAHAVVLGLVVTALVGWVGMRTVGAPGLAAGNAIGISVTAVALLAGMRKRVTDVDKRQLYGAFLRMLFAALVAAAAAIAASAATGPLPSAAALLIGALVTLAAYLTCGHVVQVEEFTQLGSAARRRLRGLRHPVRVPPPAAGRNTVTRASAVGRSPTVSADGSTVAPEARDAMRGTSGSVPAGPGRQGAQRPSPVNVTRRRAAWIVGATVVGGCAGLLTSMLMPATFEARATILVLPTGSGSTHLSSVAYAQALARLIGKDPFAVAGQAAPTSPPGSPLLKRIRVTASPDSPLVEITASGPTPSVAATAASVMWSAAITEVGRDLPPAGFRLAPGSAATPPASATAPNARVDTVVGAGIGALLGLVLVAYRPLSAVAAPSRGRWRRPVDDDCGGGAAEQPRRRRRRRSFVYCR